jgi:hypothetical protein
VAGTQRAGAQAAPPAKYDFDSATSGFNALLFRDGAMADDADSSATVVKEGAKTGAGALLYTYKVEPKALRTLVATTKLPATAQSVGVWVRGDTRTQMLLSLREEDGSLYQVPFYLPAHEWVRERQARRGPGDIGGRDGPSDDAGQQPRRIR